LKRNGLNFEIRIVGDGPLQALLDRQARLLDVADRVHLLPHTGDVPRLLTESSFLIHTADYEGCPNAVMEAMACGRAVVATGVGDVPHLVDDGKTGFVVPRDDELLLIDRMKTLIADRELCWLMGKAAAQKARQAFSLTQLVQNTIKAYRRAGWKDTKAEPDFEPLRSTGL
jgi:glycosyltransferase involved in cell wall biosynthesis